MRSPFALFPLHLSAASGIVRVDDKVLVVADDEHFIDVYTLDDGERTRHPLPLGAPLPGDQTRRKRLKADLESLVLLDEGTALALGSGSAPGRDRGVLLDVSFEHAPRVVNLAPVYDVLRRSIPTLNIESASADCEVLRLFHRGNGRHPSAVIGFDLKRVRRELDAGVWETAPDQEITVVDLGVLDGVPLGFTDACPVPGRSGFSFFVAAAEDTDNAYDDGECVGSVLGLLDARGRVVRMERLGGRHKMEGVCVDGERLLLVADPDDASVRESLYSVPLPHDWLN